MRRSIFGWDLPPGVRTSDIPGNRPEDEAWERIQETFWDKERLTKTHIGIRITEKQYKQMEKLYNSKLNSLIEDYISAAIEYGVEVGEKNFQAISEENKYYLSRYHEQVRNPKLREFFKKQRETIKFLLNIG